MTAERQATKLAATPNHTDQGHPMRPRQPKNNHNPANMSRKEIKQANALHKRMKAALAKDRAEREER